MWAEWYRNLAERGQTPLQGVPREVWAFDISLTVADLSTGPRMRRVKLPAKPIPDRTTWPRYQAVGHRLYEAGFGGILARSAARPDWTILCIFRPEVAVAGLVGKPTYLGLQQDPPVVPVDLTT